MSPETRRLAERYIREVLDSGILSGMRVGAPDGGPFLQLFEKEISEMFSVPFVVAMNSATTALHAALASLGVGVGDRVLVSGITMTASASAVYMAGATPIFVDVDPRTGLATPQTIIETAIEAERDNPLGRPPVALVAVHLFGQVVDLYSVKHHLPKIKIVEDCAQAPACVDREGEFAGLLGEVGVFSLNQHKVVQCGEGGFAVTRSRELYERLRLVRNHGENHSPEILGSNYRLTELDAAVAYADVAELFDRQARRKYHSVELSDLLTANELYRPMEVGNPPYMYYAWANAGTEGAPAPWRRGYSTPLCCIPYFKARNEAGCLVGAHEFNARVLVADPPESTDGARRLAAALLDSKREEQPTMTTT